jgi:release factor glutamine methyltransferase
METLLTAWKSARERLAAAGVESPALDARMLIEAATGATRLDILTDPYRTLDGEAQARAEALIVRREAREPVSQIVGYRDFRVHRFAVTPRNRIAGRGRAGARAAANAAARN